MPTTIDDDVLSKIDEAFGKKPASGAGAKVEDADVLGAIDAAFGAKSPDSTKEPATQRQPRPAMVRGPFGTPIPPLSVEENLHPGPGLPDYPTTASYGAAGGKDVSGKPLLSYWDKVQQQWTTDKTRAAFKVDPTIPKPLDRSIVSNGRMPAAESAAIKKALGGTYSEELDHKIALGLGGSNDKENLQLEGNVSGTKNTATDPLETSLAQQVVSGKISWVDAQRQLAKAKGFSLPEDQQGPADNKAAYVNAEDAEKLSKQPNTSLPGRDELPGLAIGKPGAPTPNANFDRNSKYAKRPAGGYVTQLPATEEARFQQWVKQNKIPWQDAPNADYDMRGFWKAQQSGDKNAKRGANLHFPDTYKTPFHQSFSNESQYATQDAPHWDGNKLIGKDGSVVFDEDAPQGGAQPSAPLTGPGLAGKATGISAAPGGMDFLDRQIKRIKDAVDPQRFDAQGQPLPEIPLQWPVTGPMQAASGVGKLFGRQAGPVDPMTAARLGQPEAAEHTMAPEAEAKASREAIQSFNSATEGVFKTLAPLGLFDPTGASMAAMPAYSMAASLSQKALEKTGIKPPVAEAITNLALMFGPAVFEASRIEVPTDPTRDFAIGIMYDAAKKATTEYPNFENMTPKAQEGILSDAERSVFTDLVNADKVQKAEFAKKIGMNPEDLYSFVNPERFGEQAQEAPAAAPGEPAQLPAPQEGTDVSPETAEPPPATEPPQPSSVAQSREQDPTPPAPEAPPTSPHEILAQGLERTAQELRDAAPEAVQETVPKSESTVRNGLPDEPPVPRTQRILAKSQELEAQGKTPDEVSAAILQEFSRRRENIPQSIENKADTPPTQTVTKNAEPDTVLQTDAEVKQALTEAMAQPEPYGDTSGTTEKAATTVPIEPAAPAETAAPPKVKANSFQRQQAQLYVNRIKDPVARDWAKRSLDAMLNGKAEPERGEQIGRMVANGIRQSLTDYLQREQVKPAAEVFPPDVIEKAHQELMGARGVWSELPAPGRFEHVTGDVAHGTEKGAGFYGITSPRPKVEELYPWLKGAPISLKQFEHAMDRGKGADYERLLTRAAEHITIQKEEAAPIIAEFADELKSLAEQIKTTDPALAETLDELARGEYIGVRNLRAYVEEKITDAQSAADFSRAFDELATAEAGEFVSEESAEPAQPDSQVREDQTTLPGLEQNVAEQKAAAAKVQGEKLTAEINKPAESIEAAAGEMETKSPLFRGTAASPQNEMFAPGGAPTTSKPPGSAKARAIAHEKAVLEEVYKPGNVVGSYGRSFDKVLAFKQGDPAKSYPENSWQVQVVESDQNGNVVPGARPRWHSTPPEKRDLAAAEKRLAVAAGAPHQTLTLYHGTTSESVADIRSGGLTKGMLTDSHAEALEHANRRVNQLGKGTPVVLEVNVPRSSVGEAVPIKTAVSDKHLGNYYDLKEKILASNVKPPLEGPGTPAAGQFDPTKSSLGQLTEALSNSAKVKDSPETTIRRALDLARPFTRTVSAATGALTNLKAVAAAVSHSLTVYPEWTNYKDTKGTYQLAIQKSAHEINAFVTKMIREFPDPERRAAMSAFVEAAGDEKKLTDWASRSKGESVKAYKAALKLTDEEKTAARNIHQFQEERAQYAIEQGIMEHAVENYVMHVWDKENKFTRGVVNVIRTKMLQPNPNFAKKRVFPTFFDGEQAGFKAKTKDIAELAAAHEHSLNEAVAARAFIKSMLSGKAKDGRPLAVVSGAGQAIEAPTPEAEKFYLTNPKSKPEEIADYRSVDHPALRQWKWATKDGEGNPIYVKGDMVIHPEAYQDLKNVLGHSALKAWNIPGTDISPGKVALKLSGEFKATLLSLSLFHQTQITLHGLEHRVNPARLKELDFSDHKQMNLVKHGLQIATFHGKEAFSEGVSGSGLINRVPGIGPYLQDYQTYLFGSYIPRVKMTMALDALERNTHRYKGELTADQIYEMTANQGNAAFGELNYVMLGRNKTLQDVLRVGLLAPDFFEARARFVGQAANPYGREQLTALLLGAGVLYIGARILNQLLDGDPHWDPQDAFDVVAKGKSYGLRTIQGDILHAFTDPRGFVFNRLNPIYGRGTIEAITGRDAYGRKRTPGEQISDLVKGAVPIPGQGLLKSKPDTVADTALTSIGVNTFPYSSPAQRMASQFVRDSIPDIDQSPDQEKASRKLGELVSNIRLGKQSPDTLKAALDKGDITADQFKRAVGELQETKLESDVKRLSIEQALQVFDTANEQERAAIAPLVVFKVNTLAKRTPAEREKLIPKLDEIVGKYGGVTAGGLSAVPEKTAVDTELARLNKLGLKQVAFPNTAMNIDGIRFKTSPTEQAEYQQLRGGMVRTYLDYLFSSQEYSHMEDADKLGAAQDVIDEAEQDARDEMKNRLSSRTRPGAVPTELPGASVQ